MPPLPSSAAPAQPWQIRIFVPREAALAVEDAFADLAAASSSFEVEEDGAQWRVDIITQSAPQPADIAGRLALVAGLLGIDTPAYDAHPLAPKDWVSEVEHGFPPLHVGRFYVYGSHISDAPPQGKIALQVNAGAAFGSGEHSTTSGCLLALGRLARGREFHRPLDMGCGSGILALAMAKLWKCPITGVDNDPVCVAVASENARRNGAQHLTRFGAGDGYRAKLAQNHAPYDLIVANILARPLMKMAPALADNVMPGGFAVLSGLLESQERMVLAAHRAQGLRLHSRIRQSGWSTLVLR